MQTSKEIYEKRKRRYEALTSKQRHTINFISMLRLIIFVSSLGFAAYFYLYKKYYFSIGLILIGLVIFIVLMLKHSKVIENKRLAASILSINELSIMRIKGEWKSFKDKGEDFKDNEHNFSDDLDIFGESSLFQWINNAHTPLGRIRLKERLVFPELNNNKIYKTQQSVKELSKEIGWRQRFAAEGSFILTDKLETNELFAWAEKKSQISNKVYFKLLLILLPLATIVSIVLYLFLHNIGYIIPLVLIGVNLSVLKLGEKQRTEILDTIFKYKKNLKLYYKMLKLAEEKSFHSELLKDIQHNFLGEKEKASEAIHRLSKVSDKISDRSNFFNIIINVIFLWDYHLIILLDEWKGSFGKDVELWLNALGELEALSSLSIIGFDNPSWTTPKLNETLKIQAVNAAHPLLTTKAVSNSVEFNHNSSILLITGSNMSGKSTFLRTLGINLVLAYAGAQVYASEFSCGLMNIYTCMRISDNLEKNISSFYAEIIRIKKIVSAVDNGEPVFFLLDEIFKGTNSLDRHMGAEALINMLSRKNAIGLVSTHDLELGDLEYKNPRVKNYNFQEYYKDNKIYFDYKLRMGISTTRNAKFLMKLAGIEFQE